MRSLALCIATLLLASCTSSQKVKADISEYGAAEIVISGLADSDFSVTPDELAQLECVRRSASGRGEKAGSVTAVGPTLGTFLAQYGKAPSDFLMVRFFASDEYRVTLMEGTLTEKEIILSVAAGDKPLAKAEQPLRILAPGLESSQWIYAIQRIEFVPLPPELRE
jgi:hypothetical protein